MTHKLVLLIVICSLVYQINGESKDKKLINQNGLRFYSADPSSLEWWRALIGSGNRNQQLKKIENKIKTKAIGDLTFPKKPVDKSELLVDNLGSEQDEFEPVGATDFEMINFWPGLVKREDDYGHLRFGRAADLKKPFFKKTLDKKVETDYGHFRFGK